jgi:aryl-alcohol dehydrogenase-like predicted oxidoreductase
VVDVRARPARGPRGGHASSPRAGFNFLADARYNDETGKAPIPTGYSEVLFGELFRAALAIAFALANPVVARVLFGATSPGQIVENAAALEVDDATVQRIAV